VAKYITQEKVTEQSKNTYAQWGPTWRKWAKRNGEMYRRNPRPHTDLLYCGIGRSVLICGMGVSLENQIEVIKQHQGRVDIACVDKAFGQLIKHGIKPRFVFVADAAVSFEDHAKEYIEEAEDVTLIMNVTGNPKWSENWPGPVYYYVNKDTIGSEIEFATLSGCDQIIPASSNVGYTAVVFIAQMMGYEKHLLVGYDFCWKPNENYYAFNDDLDKRSYMRHQTMISNRNELIFSSSNLFFSEQWMAEFMRQISRINPTLVIKNCSEGFFHGLMPKLETQLQMCQRRKLRPDEKQKLLDAHRQDVTFPADVDKEKLDEVMNKPGMAPVAITISIVPQEVESYARRN